MVQAHVFIPVALFHVVRYYSCLSTALITHDLWLMERSRDVCWIAFILFRFNVRELTATTSATVTAKVNIRPYFVHNIELSQAACCAVLVKFDYKQVVCPLCYFSRACSFTLFFLLVANPWSKTSCLLECLWTVRYSKCGSLVVYRCALYIISFSLETETVLSTKFCVQCSYGFIFGVLYAASCACNKSECLLKIKQERWYGLNFLAFIFEQKQLPDI